MRPEERFAEAVGNLFFKTYGSKSYGSPGSVSEYAWFTNFFEPTSAHKSQYWQYGNNKTTDVVVGMMVKEDFANSHVRPALVNATYLQAIDYNRWKINLDFAALFFPDRDMVEVEKSRYFPVFSGSLDQFINMVDNFKMIPSGYTPPAHICDCGAWSTGVKDEEDAHDSWCKTRSMKWKKK